MIPEFGGSFDPANVNNYLFSFELDAGESIASVAVTLDSASTALGLALGSGAIAPVALNTDVRFWISCAADQQENPAFRFGHEALITATVTTSASPARVLQKTGLLMVRQSDGAISTLMPVSLTEAKGFLRVEVTDDDALILGLVTSAAALLQSWAGIYSASQSVTVRYPDFTKPLRLLPAPFNSLVSASYMDEDGDLVELPATVFRLATRDGVPTLVLRPGQSWPTVPTGQPDAVQIVVSAGWALNADVDWRVKEAALLMVSNAYDNRDAPMVITPSVAHLLAHWRNRNLY